MIGAAFVVSLAASAVLAAPVPAPASVAVDAVQNATAYYYYQDGRAGACGKYSADSELVVGLPAEEYPAPFDTVSPYCGKYVLVSGINKNITARVADASTLNNTMTFSIGAWDALNATETGLTTVSWRFANETEAAAAAKAAESQPTTPVAAPSSTRSVTPKKPSSSSATAAASTTSAWVAPSSSDAASSSSATYTTSAWESSASSAKASSSWVPSSSAEASSSSWAPSPSAESSSSWAPASSSAVSSSAWQEASSTSSWVAPSSTSTSSWVAPSSSSTSSWVAPSSTSTWVAPTTTTTTSEWVAPTTTQAAATKAVSNANSGSYSGQATFYTQGGAAGSCGVYNSDSAYIVALSYTQVDGGAHCGQTVHITNTQNGKSISATVADTCPGCGYGSLDLSTAAFGALGSYDQGVLPITWSF